jgi:hypothetical protein
MEGAQKDCENCKYEDLPSLKEPCRSCEPATSVWTRWEPREPEEDTPMINTKARDSVAQGLRECKDSYMKRFDIAIEAISEAGKPEEVMEAKKRLLMGISGGMPLSTRTCYFCDINRKSSLKRDCDNCEYAKHHGKCSLDSESTWATINRLQMDLTAALDSYYKGETYTDPEREKRHAEYLRLKAEFEPQESEKAEWTS